MNKQHLNELGIEPIYLVPWHNVLLCKHKTQHLLFRVLGEDSYEVDKISAQKLGDIMYEQMKELIQKGKNRCDEMEHILDCGD